MSKRIISYLQIGMLFYLIFQRFSLKKNVFLCEFIVCTAFPTLFSTTGKTLRADLAAKRDFRGIPPTLWYVFVELYGRDKGQELCRYTMNAYDPPLVKHTIGLG